MRVGEECVCNEERREETLCLFVVLFLSVN